MHGVVRKLRVGLAVAMTVVIGGGFATAAGNDPDEVSHSVQYEIMSFRAISLSSTATVDFGNVRQGHSAIVAGPVLYYATTWASDAITVSINSDTAQDVFLKMSVGEPSGPSSVTPAATADGGPACDGAASDAGTPLGTVTLSTASVNLISGITDCGIDTFGYWVTTPTTFRVDATGANSDTNYSGVQTKIVTYVIDAGA